MPRREQRRAERESCEGTTLSRRQWLAAVAGGYATAAWHTALAATANSTDRGGLVLRDLERFQSAYTQLEGGTSSLAAAQWYFDGATEGLQAYLKTYGVTSGDPAERLSSHPRLPKAASSG